LESEGREDEAMEYPDEFPEQPREGSEAHSDARRRLDEARTEQSDMSDALDDSKETSGEADAASDLSAAKEKVAAREAWVSWIERGY
jgi:hypothetical protein